MTTAVPRSGRLRDRTITNMSPECAEGERGNGDLGGCEFGTAKSRMSQIDRSGASVSTNIGNADPPEQRLGMRTEDPQSPSAGAVWWAGIQGRSLGSQACTARR